MNQPGIQWKVRDPVFFFCGSLGRCEDASPAARCGFCCEADRNNKEALKHAWAQANWVWT